MLNLAYTLKALCRQKERFKWEYGKNKLGNQIKTKNAGTSIHYSDK